MNRPGILQKRVLRITHVELSALNMNHFIDHFMNHSGLY